MSLLSEVSQGRDNNLNLIRMIAASAVLVSHAYPIALGPGTREPLAEATGFTLGALAVFAFFTISGFLIAASFERSSSWLRFLKARALRLFPGLMVSLLLVTLVMGPLVSSLGPIGYLTHPETWSFLWRNTALYDPQYRLPGVFETNPYKTVEGSIWTLFHEVVCYMGIFLAGIAGLLARRGVMTALLVAYFALWLGLPLSGIHLPAKAEALHHLSLSFALGTAFYLWQHRLPISLPVAMALIALAWAAKDTALAQPAVVLALGYAVFWLAYVPGGVLRAYNRLGDYSYGMYIYAFPLQGLAVWLWGPQTPLWNMVLAFPATLILSVLSWHLVEAPSLALLKRRVAGDKVAV